MKNRFWKITAAVLCAALTLGLAGCGSGGTSESAGGTQTTAQSSGDGSATSIGTGQRAIYATYDMPALDMDPSVNFNNSICSLLNIYDTLLRYDYKNDSFVYVACDKYEKSEDGLTWTFHIREGMKFHDGTPVNAEAVKFSFERTKSMGKGAAFIWDAVESFEVKDEYNLVINLSYSQPMDLTVCSPYGAYIMSPATVGEAGEDFFSGAVDAGSGPYYIESRTGNTQLVLSAFAGYWDGWKENSFEKVVLTQASESSTRRQMLEGGDADFVSELPSEDNEALAGNENLTLVKTQSFENLNLLLNTEKSGPLQNEKVRQALSYAFPYQDVVDYVLGGNGTQAYGPVPAGLWGHSEEVLQYSYDLEKAKALLAEAGYAGGGFSLVLTYVTGDEVERKAAELYQSELDKLGISLEVRPLTSDMFVEMGQNTDPEQRQDMSLIFWYPDVPGPYTFLYTFYHQSEPISWNWTYYKDDAFDAMIDEANLLSGSDRDAATKKFIEAQNYIMEKACSINIYDKVYCRIYNKSVGGYVDDPSYPNTVFFHQCYRQ
ncbi:ABC transporter substrate-binding protein [Cuneatibacter sp. NSJ-177]|uniref:ABC transporter substrate-binding protein n=1 Tax=Cuneatibacter sp. NSJ-177 TaxID=2931401 RepID=UPI001FD2B21B|nr:ABC transporter substrate-binding protein [Cuneatibacter sp. NSJ-177]MCJ7836217.1 ABC transporter substrate-binding protein [Cuneatibacter sp. NSJ-177]